MILIQQPTERRKRIGGKEILLPPPFVFLWGRQRWRRSEEKRACDKKILYGGNRGIQVGGNASSRRWGTSPTTSANLFFATSTFGSYCVVHMGKFLCSPKNKNIFPCFGRVLKWHAFVAADKNSPPPLFLQMFAFPFLLLQKPKIFSLPPPPHLPFMHPSHPSAHFRSPTQSRRRRKIVGVIHRVTRKGRKKQDGMKL